MGVNIKNDKDKLVITYEIKGLSIIKYITYIIIVVGPIYNLYKNVLPTNSELKTIILKGVLEGSFWILIGLIILYYINQHSKTKGRKIIFDNKNRQIIDDGIIYSYDYIENIDVVMYNKYKNNIDKKAVDGTTLSNYLTTFVAKINLKGDKTIALYIGLRTTCKKIIKEVNNYIKEER